MSHIFSRRQFIRTTTMGGAGLLAGLHGITSPKGPAPETTGELYTLSDQLVRLWGQTLLNLQVTDAARTAGYGGILCPTYKIIHGRVGDTIYPFLHLAAKTKDVRYVDGAMLLYRWMEKNVSQDDGSWLNEPVKGAWKGTTIFSIIALCDALHYHGGLLDETFKQTLRTRLKKAGDYVYNTFTIDYGNINYPITASYGLTLLGEILDHQPYKIKGKELAHQALSFFTKKDHLLFGEGDPYYQASPKGCYSVDLGYNVEESLPSLVMYGLMTKDEEVLEVVTRSLQAHMEFMLPDGGWDNSWGTRNYKWTYWGSRTSDGCQPAHALLAHRNESFYYVALKNTQLLQQCTHDGLLYGGLHYKTHNVPTSVHHTFCHIKALTTILDREPFKESTHLLRPALPRENSSYKRFFADIQTWLIGKGGYRATVTGYDREYKKTKNGHATGGALTMLWHEDTGPLLTASMNEYQLYEAGNMQVDNDPLSICLTPRIEMKEGNTWYSNICDLRAEITDKMVGDETIITVHARLVDGNQQSPATGEVHCIIHYMFTPDMVRCTFTYKGAVPKRSVRVVFPVISATGETFQMTGKHTMTVNKPRAVVKLQASKPLQQLPTTGGRVFNFVPGLEAIPLVIGGNDIKIQLEVLK